MSYSQSRRLRISMMIILLGLLLIASRWAPVQVALAEANPASQLWDRVWSAGEAQFSADPVTAAWERVRKAGSYHFTSDVVQITIPTAKVTNVGRPSRSEQIYLEGQNDLNAAALEFQLWTQGGSAHNAESALAVRAADGKSYTRQGTGDWQESSSYSNVIAPNGDFMAYLAAARDITGHEPETRAGLTFTRYTFQIDGPAFAAFTRNQLEAAMRAKGELPQGVHFDLPAYYREMSGDGELWVRENGLPLRQILNLHFPEQNDATVQAQIKVDFSQFGQTHFVDGEFVQVDPAAAANSTSRFAAISNALQRQASTFASFLALLPILGLAAVVVAYRRRRSLQVALSLAVIASMVVGPLLSTLNLTSFLDTQAARAAEQSATQSESAMLRELRAQDSAPQFNPHQNPLEVAAAAPASASALIGSAAPALQTTNVLLVDTGLDTDHDGLTDFMEQRIGTSIVLSDTDGDTISDNVEIAVITTATADGQTIKKWYSNPLEADSNGDSIADTLEYDVDNNGKADDTDGDKIPDLFDEDNDNDGIPDRMDLAPFAKSSTTFGDSNPLLLKVENLTVQGSSGMTVATFVDFQLRPSTAAQLQVAENLLDWPRDDEGQLQDIDNQPADMKLLPMLEIRIPDGAKMLPPERALAPYGIVVNDAATAGEKIAYVPLNLVTDPQSGQRVAFSGRMLYLPQDAWQQPHQVRLVWVVQIANDYACASTDAGYDINKGYCANQPQIVHRYYEDWILTGLNVVEEHGADMALVYEDPTVHSVNDGAMWLLTSILGERFLAAGDYGNNTIERLLTMANLKSKLDRTSNNGVPLYGLPNNFHVVTEHTDTFDEAIYKVGAETTKNILNTTFSLSNQNTNSNQKPLLLYAYETNLRNIGLDASHIDNSSNSYASFSGSTLTMNFDPPGNQPNTSVETTAGFKWTPYCNTGGQWDPCDPVAYWQELETRHGNQFLDPDTLDLVSASLLEPGVAEGEMVATQLYALTLLQGFSSPVMRDSQLVTGLYPSENESALLAQVNNGLLLGGAIAKWAANREILKGLTRLRQVGGAEYPYREFLKRLGLKRIDQRGTFSTIRGLSGISKAGAVTAIGLVVLGTATATILALAGYEEAELPAQIGVGVIQSAAMVGVPIRTVFIASRELNVSTMQILKGSSAKIGYTQKAGAIGAGIAIGITWGVFIANATANNMLPFGVAFNSALASTIASTILIILLTIISLNPYGLIIVGIIAVLDILLTLLCEYGGADGLRTDFTGGCFTISGAATATIVKALYNYDLMVNTQRADLVTTGAPDINLTNPNLGYVGSNTISLTFPITTHAVHKDPDPEAGIYVNFYLWFFSKDNLRSSTFKYSLSPDAQDITGLARDQMTNQWKNVAEDHKYVLTPMYGGKASVIPDATLIALPPQAGLNQTVEFYQNMGYAIPAYECWLVPVPLLVSPATPICYTRTFKGKSSTLVDSLRLDIFPATLTEFLATVQKADGGFGLKWDAAFRSLEDEDGDGLLASRIGGADPDDRKWDTDGDGLSDSFELQQQQEGVKMSPIQKDTDGDGLTDAQELLFGTNPGLFDSDNDGLKDGAEVWHRNADTGVWEGGVDVRINASTPFTIHVSSDPNAGDSDGDGVSDAAEYQLAGNNSIVNGKPVRNDDNNVPFHPNVVNTPPVRIYVTNDAVADRYVTPGQQLLYTTTVVATAPLDPGVLDVAVRNANGTPSNLLGVTSQRYGLPFNPLTLSTAPTITRQTTFNVNGSGSVSLTISNTVRTQLEGSGLGPWQWNSNTGGSWSFSGLANQRMFSEAAPTSLDRPDQYLMTTTAMPTSSFDTPGDIKTQDTTTGLINEIGLDTFNRVVTETRGIFGGFFTTLLTTTKDFPEISYRYPPSAPDVACNESGNCMVVWDHIDNCGTATINSIEVLKEGTDGKSGIEPVIFLVRDFLDNDPTNGGYELLWYAGANGGNDMQKNEIRGPNALGFPITFDFCDYDRIVVYESDNQQYLNVYNLADWSKQGLAGSNFVKPGGFWNETGDTVGLLYNDSTCSGCEIRLSVTSVSKQIHNVAGALLDASGNVSKAQFNLSSYNGNDYTVGFHRPTVATDGKDFLVAWERAILPLGYFRHAYETTTSDAIITRRFSGNGTPLTNNTLVTGSDATTTFLVAPDNNDGVRLSRARLVLNWVGDRYQITRLLLPHEVNPTGEWGQGITIRDLDGNGQLMAGSFAHLFPDARKRLDDRYDWAYDPINKRGLLLYWRPTNNFLQGRLFQSTGTGTYALSVPTLSPFSVTIDAGSPQVEYDPTTNGWMVGFSQFNPSHASVFKALDANVSVQLGVQAISNQPAPNGNALACPAFQSLPLIDLRFEEVPNATIFENLSGYGSDATCSPNQCPFPGAAGAPGARLSAYALEFDDDSDFITSTTPNQLNGSFSLAFWYKAGAGGGGPAFYVTSNPPNTNNNPGFGLYIYNNGIVEWWAGRTRIANNSSLNDGNWHFVAATYASSNGKLSLFVDGANINNGTVAQIPTLAPTITIGGGSTRALLDQFQFYGVPLSAGAVANIRVPGALQPFCIASSVNNATQAIQWNKLSIAREENFTPIEKSVATIITIDNDAPTASVTGAQHIKVDGSSTILTIGGAAQDPTSGIASVAVSVNGGTFQPAEGRESWVYQFPVSEGVYAVRAKATDILGHIGNPSVATTIIADATPPQVTINPTTNPIKPMLNGNGNWQVALSGTASDPLIGSLTGSGVNPASVQVRLVGADGVSVSDQWQTATYNENSKAWTIQYLFPATRVDVTGVYTVSVRAEDLAGSSGGNSTGDNGATAILKLSHTGPAVALSTVNAARSLITETVTISGPVSSLLSGITKVEVAFTTVERIAALPSNLSFDEAQAQLDTWGRIWLPATLAAQGPGITSTTWSLLLPNSLEGEYQIDLRGTDGLGNLLISSKAWRGIIDTQAPRVFMKATSTGSTYINRDSGQEYRQFSYECSALDRYLVEGAYSCPGESVLQPTRIFNTDPYLQTLFPDRTILVGMRDVYYKYEPLPLSTVTIEACDLFGKCSTASVLPTLVAARTQVMAANVAAASVGAPQALVISPEEGRYVAANGALPVTIVAEAAASLQQVTVQLDGNVVATLPFAQSENITYTQRTIQLPMAQGVHTLVAKATDWNNVTQTTLYPVAFTLDSADPLVTLDTDLLGLADTWALGSDMLRFNGTASDDVGLAAVQIKIGDAAFAETNFDSGTWHTAQLVPDPQGKSLAVIVRAIDKAGRISSVTGNIGVDLTPTEVTITPPDTTITPTVVNASANSVSVSFAGVDGSNEVAAFECRVDGGAFQPCASPQQYAGLNNGVNHFEVRAIDSQGFVDLTPAAEDWTIAVTALQTTISEQPSSPTVSRDATFVFSGAPSFECALDGAAYTPCNSPQHYTGLSDGEHSFLVRGLDGSNRGAATRFAWIVENQLPIADDQFVTTFQNMAIDITLTASDNDPLIYRVDQPAHGLTQFIAPNVVRYTPDSGYGGPDSFTFVASDQDGASNPATVTVQVNAEPVIVPNPPTQTVQYSDGIPPVTLTVSDEDSTGSVLTLSPVSWTTSGGVVTAGLPPQLTLQKLADNGATVPGHATWLLTGTVDLPVGIYTVTVVGDDNIGGSITGEPVEIAIQVLAENVMMRFPGGNPRAVQVPTAGSPASGAFELKVDIKERYPDRGFAVQPGDITRSNVSLQLVPIGPGGSVNPTATCLREIHDIGYAARLTLTCSFDAVPINTYAVAVTVDGDYYSGYDEDVVTVYDPSLGFTTGGGSFTWPETTDETSFGFSIEYNKKGKNVQGRLLVTRHLADGSVHRIKSNALEALALGESQPKGSFTWANFSGKATYQSPTMDVAEGNHSFIAYVEDHGSTGDRFWLQVKDKNGNLILDLSLSQAATAKSVPISSGEIVVPKSTAGAASVTATNQETTSPNNSSGDSTDNDEEETEEPTYRVLLPLISR